MVGSPAANTAPMPPRRANLPSAASPSTRSTPKRTEVTPWHQAGQCTDGARARSDGDRARYFATFVPFAATDTTFFVEPGVAMDAVLAVQESLGTARAAAAERLGIDVPPPLIYLYASVASLRDHACVNSSAVAYYDGAIHVAMNSPAHGYLELCKSLRPRIRASCADQQRHRGTDVVSRRHRCPARGWLWRHLSSRWIA
jgi:hypothetical protein